MGDKDAAESIKNARPNIKENSLKTGLMYFLMVSLLMKF